MKARGETVEEPEAESVLAIKGLSLHGLVGNPFAPVAHPTLELSGAFLDGCVDQCHLLVGHFFSENAQALVDAIPGKL